MNAGEVKRILETALMCTQEPIGLDRMRTLFDGAIDSATVRAALLELKNDWAPRGAELIEVAGGWRFQSRAELSGYLERLRPEKAARYGRALLETLATVAYRQPVTRGDIEEIRGVALNASIVRQLEDRGWVETVGHRETVGRPELLATTRRFLDDLGLRSLEDLPRWDGSQAASETVSADALRVVAVGAAP